MNVGPHPSLFGAVAVTPAPAAAYSPGVHPRILFDADGWQQLLSKYADADMFNLESSWSYFMRRSSLHFASNNMIHRLAEMERSGETALYTGEDLTSASQETLDALQPLASHAMNMSEGLYQSFFFCSLWTSVNEKVVAKQGDSASFLSTTVDDCVKAAVAWSKVLLAHRAVNCAGECASGHAASLAYIWDVDKWFEVKNDWFTAGSTLALTFDVLHNRFTADERRSVLSALAMLMYKKVSWGTGLQSSRNCPNAAQHPHRIFSNWAMYHGHMYITNLALEGETDFDAYASAVLSSTGDSGFNTGLDHRFSALIEAYMTHAVYPDGSTFEDAYTYFIALREGSLALVAAERKGLKLIDSDRFRALIHNVAQMMEPWQCARIVGHSSGGGMSYPAWAALFKYAYPDGALPQMVWKQRMGPDFKNNKPCRISWNQNAMHVAILGLEHGSSTFAQSPQGLEEEHLLHFPMSYFSPRRGLVIARSSEAETAQYIHFDARPDAMFPGHENADRGVFTYTALKTAWVDDYTWNYNIDSRRHSLMHIDGLAQDARAPSVGMIKVEDTGAEMIAAANLTYAYNVHWARNWPYKSAPTAAVTVYEEDGSHRNVGKRFDIEEYGHPHDFGWPLDDDGADLGFTREQFNMHGDPDVGFRGMWLWKRSYRETLLNWMTRSVVLNRAGTGPGFFLVVDSVQVSGTAAQNKFESYVMLGDTVQVESESSSCEGSQCRVVLVDDGIAQVDVHVLTNGNAASYRTELFESEKQHTRLIVRSDNAQEELFWMAFHPHLGEPERFSMERVSSKLIKVVYDGEEYYYSVDTDTHAVSRAEAPVESPPPSPTSSPSFSASPSSSSSPSPSPSSSASPSPTASPSASPSSSPSFSPSSSPSSSSAASASPSSVPSTSPSSRIPTPTPSSTPSSSLSPSPSPATSHRRRGWRLRRRRRWWAFWHWGL